MKLAELLEHLNKLDQNGLYKEADDITEKMKDDPCWEGYEMIGEKEKNGKKVPNCVPKKKD